MQKSPKTNLKIHIHLFYTNHLGEPRGYKSCEKLTIDSAREKWNQLHQKGGKKYLTITDKDSPVKKNLYVCSEATLWATLGLGN